MTEPPQIIWQTSACSAVSVFRGNVHLMSTKTQFSPWKSFFFSRQSDRFCQDKNTQNTNTRIRTTDMFQFYITTTVKPAELLLYFPQRNVQQSNTHDKLNVRPPQTEPPNTRQTHRTCQNMCRNDVRHGPTRSFRSWQNHPTCLI